MSYAIVLPSILPEYTRACIDSLDTQAREHLLVIDNTQRNLGVAGSWNVGARKVVTERLDWLVVLSAGVRFGPSQGRDFLAQLPAWDGAWCVEADEGLGWHCFAEDTEVLTDEGWKLFPSLSGTEQILTLNRHLSEARWGKISQIVSHEFEGVLNELRGGRVNFAITDDHRLFAATRQREFTLAQFAELPQQFRLKMTNGWNGSNPPIREFSKEATCSKSYVFTFEDWAEFLGWYLAEGSAPKRGPIGIAQNPGPKYERIATLLTRMGFTIYRARDRINFNASQIARWLRASCGEGSLTKRIPRELKDAGVSALNRFLDAFGQGDGTVHGRGMRYYTSSPQLADDLQEVLVKLGCAGTRRVTRKAGTETHFGAKIARRTADELSVSRVLARDAWIDKAQVRRVPYRGRVWCLVTPDEVFMVRREGRPMWSGNCIAFARQTIEQVGYFDENFWPAYFEDNDYGYRIRIVAERTFDRRLLWPKVPTDAQLVAVAHGIEQAGVRVEFTRLESYLVSKWGGKPSQERFVHPFSDPSKGPDWWPREPDPRALRHLERV